MPVHRSAQEHAEADRLRTAGYSIPEIATALGIARSTIWLWVGDVPLSRPRRTGGPGAPGALVMRRRELRRLKTKNDAARTTLGLRDARTLLALGAVAYWCEGAKDKMYDRRERVRFCNSDPLLIRLFMDWLSLVGVGRERLAIYLMIHETADVAGAEAFWSELLDVPVERFSPTVLKRHQPRTNRLNRGESYRGVLTVAVRDSRELYQQIEGWMRGAADSLARAVSAERPPRGLTIEPGSRVV